MLTAMESIDTVVFSKKANFQINVLFHDSYIKIRLKRTSVIMLPRNHFQRYENVDSWRGRCLW